MKIPLNKDCFSTVSLPDLPTVAGYKWHVNSDGYAVTFKGRSQIYMHRLILSFPDGAVDHIDGNKLNNQRPNLRVVPVSINNYNRRSARPWRGVSWCKRKNKWRAVSMKDRKQTHIGYFETKELAFEAYKTTALLLYGFLPVGVTA